MAGELLIGLFIEAGAEVPSLPDAGGIHESFKIMSQGMWDNGGEDDIVTFVVLFYDLAVPVEQSHEVLPGLGDTKGKAGDAVDHHAGETMDKGFDAFTGGDGDKDGARIEVTF